MTSSPTQLRASCGWVRRSRKPTRRASMQYLYSALPKYPPDKGAENYDKFNCDFDFLPGAAGGEYPANRHLVPSIFLPFSNLIEWQVIMSPLEASSDRQSRTLTSERPTASAISISSRSPCVLRYCRISFIGLLPHTVNWVVNVQVLSALDNFLTVFEKTVSFQDSDREMFTIQSLMSFTRFC